MQTARGGSILKYRKPYQSKRKGTTLTEMVVILAVLAIISTVVVSFSLAVSRRVRVSSAKLEAMQDVEVIEALTESWINALREQGATFELKSTDGSEISNNDLTDHAVLYASVPGATDAYTLRYNYATKTLEGNLPDGESKKIEYTSNLITKIEFTVKPGPVNSGSPGLFICKVEYTVPLVGSDTDNKFDYTFCVNPRVGYTETAASEQGGNGQ